MKQPEDTHTADLLEADDKRLADYRRKMKRIEETIKMDLEMLDQLNKEKADIEQQGFTFGTIHYKAGKYAYLIRPQQDGERKREYIGADPINIQAAEDRIKRAKRHKELSIQLSAIDNGFWKLDNLIEDVAAQARCIRHGSIKHQFETLD